MLFLHASCIALNNKAVLLTGAPGIGKSDLTLRLIDEGAVLISDDQTFVHCTDGILNASPPKAIEGMMEIRHVGLRQMPFISGIPIVLCVELTSLEEKLDRLPEDNFVFLLDQRVQQLRLPALAASTPAKIRATLAYHKTQ
jgi:serine kinase of HPr protein (carbohydrate metabolism regulator)